MRKPNDEDNEQKGPVYELCQVRKSRGTPWKDFYELMRAVCDASFTVSFVGRLEKKRSLLLRNKKKDDIEILFGEPFCGMHTIPEPITEDTVLTRERAKTEELTAKLQHLSVRNVNKRIKRRDLKIAESQAQIKEMDRERESQDKSITKLKTQLHTAHSSVHCLRQRLYRSKDKVEVASHETIDLHTQLIDMEEEFAAKVAALEENIDLLITEVGVAQHERDILSERLDDLQSNTIQTKKGQRFVDGVRQCCLELLAMNVATNQVEPVIPSVLLNIASIEVGELPKSSTLSGMLVEMKCLAYDQISEEMDTQDNITLHSDGTSKFGEHYVSYQLSTEHSSYSLGLCEMLTGSAELTLHTFKQIVSDLSLVSGNVCGEAIITKIKNTMSDRHIVQKSFNTLLEDYRADILPSVVQDWSKLSQAEQDQLSSLNNFFCGMSLHLVILSVS